MKNLNCMVPLRLGFVPQWNKCSMWKSILPFVARQQSTVKSWGSIDSTQASKRSSLSTPWLCDICEKQTRTRITSNQGSGRNAVHMYIPIVGVCMPTYPLEVSLYPFVTEIKFTPVRVHPCPLHSLWMGWINPCPSPAQLGARGSASRAISVPLSLTPPSLCVCRIPQLTMEMFRL